MYVFKMLWCVLNTIFFKCLHVNLYVWVWQILCDKYYSRTFEQNFITPWRTLMSAEFSIKSLARMKRNCILRRFHLSAQQVNINKNFCYISVMLITSYFTIFIWNHIIYNEKFQQFFQCLKPFFCLKNHGYFVL